MTTQPAPTAKIQVKRCLILTLLAAVAILTVIFPSEVSTTLGQSWLMHQAHNHLSAALAQNTAVFATLSGVKALLGVVEGSTVGVSLGASVALQLGDLVQPAYQYFDFVWEIFLYALFLISMYQLLIDSQILTVGISITFIGLIGIVWATKYPERYRRLQNLAMSVALFGLIFSFGIPTAILGTEWITKVYVRPLRDNSWSNAEQQLQSMKAAISEMATVQDRVSILRPGDSVNEVIASGQELGDKASAIAWSTFSSLLSYLAALIVELLLVPIGLVYGLRAVFRGSLYAVFPVNPR